VLRSRDSGIHQIVSRSSELGEYDRLEALQGRDRVRWKQPAVKRSRLQDEIAGFAGIGVGKDVVVAEDQVVLAEVCALLRSEADHSRILFAIRFLPFCLRPISDLPISAVLDTTITGASSVVN
jgi:hypothetical protein